MHSDVIMLNNGCAFEACVSVTVTQSQSELYLFLKNLWNNMTDYCVFLYEFQNWDIL